MPKIEKQKNHFNYLKKLFIFLQNRWKPPFRTTRNRGFKILDSGFRRNDKTIFLLPKALFEAEQLLFFLGIFWHSGAF
jgi:hypothetical protein